MHKLLVAALLLVGCGGRQPPTPPEPTPAPATVEEARAFYAGQPVYRRPVPHQEPPTGLPDLRAETCGACHAEIYAEWRISTHARAWEDDPQFQAELHKSRKPDHDVGWMCVNCHTPLENQLPQLVARLDDGRLDRPVYVDNPHFDPQLQDDAITCATCHVRDGAVLGPYGDTNAPHATRKSDELKTESTCTVCHQASVHMPSVGLACAFETGEEWAEGPWDDEGYVCQTCHMPEVERPLVAGFPARATRRHWFGGSLLAKKPEFAAELQALEAHYPEGLELRWADPPALSASGGTLTAELHNAQAGHRLPTGDPERFLLITASLLRDEGVVWTATERIGQTWQWHPTAKRLADNRLLPRERRRVEWAVPPLPPGGYDLVLEASKWRLSQENLEYHDLAGKTVAGRPTHRDVTRLQIEAATPVE